MGLNLLIFSAAVVPFAMGWILARWRYKRPKQ